MPETTPKDVGIEWFRGKLAERLMQAGAMSLDRSLLRRGAKKMQDGTLGKPSDGDEVDDEMNIHIGDTTTVSPQPQAARLIPQPSAGNPAGDVLKKLVVSAALLAAGGGVGVAIPWLLGAFDKPAAVVPAATSDADTRYELRIGMAKP